MLPLQEAIKRIERDSGPHPVGQISVVPGTMKFVFASVLVAALPSALLAHEPAVTVRVSVRMWLSSARSEPADRASPSAGALLLFCSPQLSFHRWRNYHEKIII